MDDLLQAAQNYNQMLSKKYVFTLGKNKKLHRLELVFTAIDFYHLAGLHKLDDIPALRTNASIVFKKILKGQITLDTIKSSHRFFEIEGRIKCLGCLEHFIDTANDVFKYDIKKAKGSRIVDDYLLKGSLKDNTNYYFMISFKEHYVGVSFFSKSEKDYTANQMKLTMLRKEKIDSDSGEVVLLYNSPNYIA